jgi:hypothetical protein
VATSRRTRTSSFSRGQPNDEREFLKRQDELLRVALQGMDRDVRFDAWLSSRINRPGGEPTWERLLGNEFEFAVAGVRL